MLTFICCNIINRKFWKKLCFSEPGYLWLDVRRGILGPEDKRLPLPGNVGIRKFESEMSFTGYAPSITYMNKRVQVIAQENLVANPFIPSDLVSKIFPLFKKKNDSITRNRCLFF